MRRLLKDDAQTRRFATQAGFGLLVGRSEGYIRNVESGVAPLSAVLALVVAEQTGVSHDWLSKARSSPPVTVKGTAWGPVDVLQRLPDLVKQFDGRFEHLSKLRCFITAHSPGDLGRPLRRIVSAAMRNDKTGRIVLCVRHRDELFRASLLPGEVPRDYDDGFVDNQRQFLTRKEAWPIALAAGQIIRHCGGGGDIDTLYSENIY